MVIIFLSSDQKCQKTEVLDYMSYSSFVLVLIFFLDQEVISYRNSSCLFFRLGWPWVNSWKKPKLRRFKSERDEVYVLHEKYASTEVDFLIIQV